MVTDRVSYILPRCSYALQPRCYYENLSVRLSVKRVTCDKTKDISAHILTPLPLPFTFTNWGGVLPPYAEASSGPNAQPHNQMVIKMIKSLRGFGKP